MEMWFAGRSSLRHYGLEMKYCYITTPKQKRHLIDIPAADGNVDAMEGIGEPAYENRTVTACFKMHMHAEDTRTRIINDLEGKTVEIVLPNDLNHYMTGRIHIAGAGCKTGSELLVTADCIPWRYARNEVVLSAAASESEVQHIWWNQGRRLAIPEISVESEDVTIAANGKTKLLAPGIHLLSELAVPGFSSITITAHGGAFTARYREAIL